MSAVMLHLPTTLLMVTVTLMLQGLIWALVWLTQRHRFELNFLAAGFLSVAFGMLTYAGREAVPASLLGPVIILQNYLIHAGAVLIAHGIARFCDRGGNPPLMIAITAVVVVFWPASLWLAPENIAIRIIASNCVTSVVVLYIIWILAIDRLQPRVLRWTTIGFLISDVIALTLRSTLALHYYDDQVALMQSELQAWYYFYFNIFMTWLFLSILLMVGVRLAADLRQKNDDLSREVAQRRELQGQLSTSLETAKALHEEQRQLLRMVTHEFRTPLAVVDRAAEMIGVVLDKPTETVSRRLDSIRDAVRRLVQLIDRFLDVERRDLNILQTERIDIASLLEQVHKHFAGLELDPRLRFTVQPNMAFYWGDQEMLCTVLINLIDNALKYTPDGSPVDITARHENNAIVITVTDRGIGIPEAEAALIGRRFFRASNTTPATGTGLGLYNTHRLLEYHNGILSLRAGRGGGTVATIRLPLPGVVPDVSMEVA
jgi:two-component system OmpR family sensor kinase